VVALVAGMIWGSKLGVQFSLTTVALRALPVIILGGLTSVPGAIIGGLIIGVARSSPRCTSAPYVGGGIEIWFAYVLALVFLLFRPQGSVFGEKIIDRNVKESTFLITRLNHVLEKTVSSRPATGRPADLPDCPGPHGHHPGNHAVRLHRRAHAGRRIHVPRHPDSLPDPVAGGLGVNILVGYCGQISLGSGAFMAVGAYMAYNFFVRIAGMPLIAALMSGRFLRHVGRHVVWPAQPAGQGLYLAVATLAAQFFCDWMFLRIGWFTNNSSSGSVSVSNLQVLGCP
jgi:ABC-type branched-subunit amino acid transport system permease subunit